MPATNAQIARELARQSSDCSFMLTHLVRAGSRRTDADCQRILELILDLEGNGGGPVLKGGPVGWYAHASADVYNPVSRSFDGPRNSRAVCFTESTLAGLRAHRDVFDARYGIAFDRDELFARGGNPCLNIRENILKERIAGSGGGYDRAVYNFVPSQLHPYVNIIHESFDATHEREWRIPGDFSFRPDDVLFIFCPETDFPHFARIQSAGRPVLFDLAWLDRV